MSERLRYGLIGCGGCGENKHLASYERYPDEVELAAVFDADGAKAAAVAKRHGVPTVCESYESLLADASIDVVSIATPNFLHAPIAIAALDAGKHVHLEKPIAMNAAEARQIVEAKNRSGRKLMVALNNRFTKVARFAKRYVDEGNLGEIYHARCGWRRRAGFPVYGTWFADKKLSGGGPLIDLGVHFLDLTLFMMGFPAPASVSASCYDKIAHPPEGDDVAESTMIGRGAARGKKYDVEDISVGFAKLATGASVSFEFSWASHGEREMTFMELLGTRGGLTLRDGLRIHTERDGTLLDLSPQINDSGAWGENETRHFIDCIKGDTEPLSPPEQAVKMMMIIDGVYESAATGREVRFE